MALDKQGMYQLIQGDAFEVLRDIKDQSVQTIITSPPYYGLRDYGVNGQVGLEPTPKEYVEKLVSGFRELKRVLKNDGTLWLNLGDSYASFKDAKFIPNTLGGGQRDMPKSGSARNRSAKTFIDTSIKNKDLMGIPWRVAFALQDDGWYLRQDIIWHKPNPMPESVTDRCTKSHEYLFLLSKSERYYFDNEAIKEPLAGSSIKRLAQDVDKQAGSLRVPGKTNGSMKAVHSKDGGAGLRNKRSVWSVTTKPFKEAHFATFPEALVEPCVLAGSKAGDTVLDPFSGAATTGLVALKHGRKYIGIEINPDYVELSHRRIDSRFGTDKH